MGYRDYSVEGRATELLDSDRGRGGTGGGYEGKTFHTPGIGCIPIPDMRAKFFFGEVNVNHYRQYNP